MKIDLNLPAGIPQQRFLDYLNSQLRERMTQSFGSAQYGADGSFESSVIGPFLVDQDSISVNWVYRKSPDGTLLELEVMTTADTPSTNWQTAVHELVNSVYAAALAERRQLQFRRETFFYVGSVLDGEYWISGARFAPVWPEDDQPCLLNAERAVSIDQRISALDSLDAHSLRRESSARLAARLSLLLNVGLYRGKQELRWVIPLARDGVQLPASERVHLGF